MADPNRSKRRRNRKDPACMKPVTNMADPNRAQLLKDNEDPIWL